MLFFSKIGVSQILVVFKETHLQGKSTALHTQEYGISSGRYLFMHGLPSKDLPVQR